MSERTVRLVVALRKRASVNAAIALGLPGIGWRYASDATPEEFGTTEAILTGSIERELGDFQPARTPRLAFVQRIYTGMDGFPFERFPDSVKVAGNVGAFAPYVAEHAVTLALAASRSLRVSDRMVAEGRLRPVPDQVTLLGASALILGYGAIGREIARRVAGFGVRCTGLTRNGRMAPGIEAAYSADRLEEAAAEADLIFDARPLTLSTRGSINAAVLGRMRAAAIYVNVGRAGTVDEEALFQHLSSHPRFRAALDVWWSEEYGSGALGQRFPWTRLDNFVGTPHSASAVAGAEESALRQAIENVGRYFAGGDPQFVVDRRDYVVIAPSTAAPGSDSPPS